MMNRPVVLWTAAALLTVGIAAGGYYFFRNFTITKQSRTPAAAVQQANMPGPEETFTIRIYYPLGERLEATERTIPRRTRTSAIIEAVIEEYFRPPANGSSSVIPSGVKLLGTYRDASQVMYIDLSDELRRNFHADAASEYLLLKGLFETVVSNVPDIQDIKVLVEGKEIDTLGGHMLLKSPLRNLVAAEIREEKIADEQ